MHRGSGNSAPRPRAAAAASPATAGRAGFTQADILAALVGLGWRAADCRQPVERAIAALSADGGTPTAAAIIKHVLATADKSVKIGATS